jgi:hypothetical protein
MCRMQQVVAVRGGRIVREHKLQTVPLWRPRPLMSQHSLGVGGLYYGSPGITSRAVDRRCVRSATGLRQEHCHRNLGCSLSRDIPRNGQGMVKGIGCQCLSNSNSEVYTYGGAAGQVPAACSAENASGGFMSNYAYGSYIIPTRCSLQLSIVKALSCLEVLPRR